MEEGGDDMGEGGARGAGTEGEAGRREDDGGASTEEGRSEKTEGQSAEETLERSSRGEKGDDGSVAPAPLNGQKCCLCEYRAISETVMTGHLLDVHVREH